MPNDKMKGRLLTILCTLLSQPFKLLQFLMKWTIFGTFFPTVLLYKAVDGSLF